ncbi:MAG: TlyA family RNA methyltransferase [Bacillales bacterium]|nr:TlyA family RNA methyltransferase [Bacillales bacterium]
MRLDIYLVQNQYFESRNKAVYSIKKGLVLINGLVVDKPSFIVSDSDIVSVKDDALKYVSKGGLKLEKALSFYKISPKGYSCLDIGSSTGGFTDCLLQNGAKLVYSIDVGTDQLHKKLKEDSRVKSYEQTNFLDFNLTVLPKIDLICIDVSFTSIKPIIKRIVENFKETIIIALIKPQFEAGKIYMKNGVLKDKNIQKSILNDIKAFLKSLNLSYDEVIDSPIKGGSGNQEYLIKINI